MDKVSSLKFELSKVKEERDNLQSWKDNHKADTEVQQYLFSDVEKLKEERDRLKEENQHYRDNAGITAYHELKDEIYHRYDNWADRFQEKFSDVGTIDEEGQFVGLNILIPQFIREMVFSLENKLSTLEAENKSLKEDRQRVIEEVKKLRTYDISGFKMSVARNTVELSKVLSLLSPK